MCSIIISVSTTDLAFFSPLQRARSSLEIWLNLIGILEITGDDCLKALNPGTADYEDAVMQQTAARTGCDFIVTRNLRDFGFSTVKAVSPGEFVKLAMSADGLH